MHEDLRVSYIWIRGTDRSLHAEFMWTSLIFPSLYEQDFGIRDSFVKDYTPKGKFQVV